MGEQQLDSFDPFKHKDFLDDENYSHCKFGIRNRALINRILISAAVLAVVSAAAGALVSWGLGVKEDSYERRINTIERTTDTLNVKVSSLTTEIGKLQTTMSVQSESFRKWEDREKDNARLDEERWKRIESALRADGR